MIARLQLGLRQRCQTDVVVFYPDREKSESHESIPFRTSLAQLHAECSDSVAIIRQPRGPGPEAL
jgi:hypothetical protein